MLPTVEFILTDDEQTGTHRISFVENPAIGVDFIKMSAEKVWLSDEEQQIAYGAVMIPDQLIYRNMPEVGEVNAFFSADTIKQTRDKFFKNGFNVQANAEHSDFVIEGVYLVESIIKNTDRGILPPPEFSHLPDGTWFAGFRVEKPKIWKDFIKSGVFKGFSIEGLYQPVMSEDKWIEDFAEALCNKLNSIKETDS